VPVQYAVVFEIGHVEDTEAYEKFEVATEYYQTAPAGIRFLAFIGADFANVYKQVPQENFRVEWSFVPKKLDEELPQGVMIREPCWVLVEPSDTEEHPERKFRPSQQAREECRKVAKALWEKDSTITIEDMIMRNGITRVATKTNGDMYSTKTIRNWIKDLCPNRSPGRRAQKRSQN
jgi:hypothetical protein